MPPAVAEATAAYREESDYIAEFIEDCCIVEPGATVLSSALWQRYKKWAGENEEVTLTRDAFSDRLKRRGVRPDRSGHGGQRTWDGIALRGDTVTRGDATSDFFPIEGETKGKIAKTASPPVTTSPCPQKIWASLLPEAFAEDVEPPQRASLLPEDAAELDYFGKPLSPLQMQMLREIPPAPPVNGEEKPRHVQVWPRPKGASLLVN